VKPQSIAFGGTVKFKDASPSKNILRSSSPQVISHGMGSPTPKYLQSGYQINVKPESPLAWEETSVNTRNQSAYEAFRFSVTPGAPGARTDSPYKTRGNKPPKGVHTAAKVFSRES